jgi:hypothetical protein
MPQERLADEVYKLSFTCGMNQRYHQNLARVWEWGDRIAKGLVGISTLAGAMLGVASFTLSRNQALANWSLGVTIVAAVLAIILNAVPFGDWARRHLDLFARWSGLRQDADTLKLRIEQGSPDVTGVDRLEELIAKKHSINALEPAPIESRLKSAWMSEATSRTGISDRDELLRKSREQAAVGAA